MSEINKYGKSRTIPEPTKRQIRKNCGFGCVVCGFAFYHYDHFNPEFADLTGDHDPNGIALLCPNHHDGKTRQRVSREAVEIAAKNPKCLQKGYSRGPLEYGLKESIIQLGNTIFSDSKDIIVVNGKSLLSIKKPSPDNSTFLLSFMANESGNKIIDNEWFGDINAWDITTIGNKIVVKDDQKRIVLEIENVLTEKLKINKIDIVYQGVRIVTENISSRKIGSISIPKQSVLRIVNSDGIEIARLSNNSTSFNEIGAKKSLEVIDGFMNPVLEGFNIKNGTFHYLINKSPSVIGCTFGANYSDIGRYSQPIIKFIDKVNLVRIGSLPTKEKRKINYIYKSLKHQKLIEQFSLKDRNEIQKIMK